MESSKSTYSLSISHKNPNTTSALNTLISTFGIIQLLQLLLQSIPLKLNNILLERRPDSIDSQGELVPKGKEIYYCYIGTLFGCLGFSLEFQPEFVEFDLGVADGEEHAE